MISFCFADFDIHLHVNSSGVLTSPYYPWSYLSNITRRWLLETFNKQQIYLKFLYINIEDDPKCNNDYISFQDGEISEKKFYFCGKTIPVEFKSSSNKVLIVFKSNQKIARTGFKIQYKIAKGKRTIVFCCACIVFHPYAMSIFFINRKKK